MRSRETGQSAQEIYPSRYFRRGGAWPNPGTIRNEAQSWLSLTSLVLCGTWKPLRLYSKSLTCILRFLKRTAAGKSIGCYENDQEMSE